MNVVETFNETKKAVDLGEIKNIAEYTLSYENVELAEMNIIFVDNDKIKEINKDYRNKDYVTDVISFALEDNNNLINKEVRILGDIFISINKAEEQANEFNHSLERELSFLAIHGTLHLLGYDHMTKEEESIMFEKQEVILNELKIKR